MPKPTDRYQKNLLKLQSDAAITTYRNIDAGSVYNLAKDLQAIAQAYTDYSELTLLGQDSQGDHTINAYLGKKNIKGIVDDGTKSKIIEVVGTTSELATSIWLKQKLDVEAGFDEGMSESNLLREARTILTELHQVPPRLSNTKVFVKTIEQVLDGKKTRDNEEIARGTFTSTQDESDIQTIIKKIHLIDGNKMEQVRQQANSYKNNKDLQELETQLIKKLEELSTEVNKCGTSSPVSPEKSKDGLIKQLPALLGGITKKRDMSEGLTQFLAVLREEQWEDTAIIEIMQEVKRLAESALKISGGKQVLLTGQSEVKDTDFMKGLKTDLDLDPKKIQIDCEQLCDFLIKVDDERKKCNPNDKQRARLLDIKAGLLARHSQKKIKEMQQYVSAIWDEVVKSWEENMGMLDQGNDGRSGTDPDKEKLRLQDNTIDQLQNMLWSLSKGVETVGLVHKKLLAAQKTVKRMHSHQKDVATQAKTPTWLGRIQPIFSSHYALSAVTLFSILAGTCWLTSWYVAPMIQAVLQPLALGFAYCAGEKLISQIHTAYVRKNIALREGDRPSFLESFWSMPATGRSNGLLSLLWIGIPYLLMAMANLTGAGIVARFAAVGRFFQSAEKRLQLTAAGLTTVCASKVYANQAAVPQSATNIKESEVEILYQDKIQEFARKAEEACVVSFANRNIALINELVRTEYDDNIRDALTKLSNFQKDKRSVTVKEVVQAWRQLQNATIVESKPRRNRLIGLAYALEKSIPSTTSKLAKKHYIVKQQAALTQKHYGLEDEKLVALNKSIKPKK